MPAEQSFYLMMRDQILREPLQINGGRVHLPAASDTARLVDWDKVARYGINRRGRSRCVRLGELAPENAGGKSDVYGLGNRVVNSL